MNSRSLSFILTMLAVIPCSFVPPVLASQFGLVFSWWGPDAEAFIGLLLLLGLAPMIVAAGVAVVLFFRLAAKSFWQRWFLNGAAVGLFTGVASLVSIHLKEAWPVLLAPHIVVSGIVACGLDLAMLFSLNRIVDRIRHG